MTYYYDGEGERVAKSTGKLYLFGTGSAPVVETDASGTMTAEYVFFNGKRVAMRKADNSVHYYFADQIGSANVVTNATGAMPPEQDIEYHPYGEQQVYADTLGQQYKFTGKEHDPETNNDYFGARYYSSTMGRFLTPDWAATPVPIPYAVMGNPQTLNLYSYVENNPITGTDPDGHDGPERDGSTCEQQKTCDGNEKKKEEEDARAAATATEMADRAMGTQAATGDQASGSSKATAQQQAQNTTAAVSVPFSLAPELPSLGELASTLAAAGRALVADSVSVAATPLVVATYLVSPGAQVDKNELAYQKGGPKAADAPGVTAGGQATNEHGQKIAPSGKPQVNEVNRNTREGAKNAANRGSGTIHDQNPKNGDRSHFHPARGDGSKVRDGSHYYYPE